MCVMTRGFISRLVRAFLMSQSGCGRRTRRHRALSIESMEPRLVLSNLNLVAASSNLIYGGGAEVNTLDVSFDGTKYTFNDTSGAAVTPIGVAGFAALDTNAAANIVTFNAAAADALVAGGAITLITINPNGGADTTTITSFRPGAEGLTVSNNAGDGMDTVNIVGNIGTGAMPVKNTIIVKGEDINLTGSVWAKDKGVTFDGPVDLLANVKVDAGTAVAASSVAFNSTVNGAWTVEAKAFSVTFNGTVGGVTPLKGFWAHDSAANTVRTKTVTVNGGDILLEADTYVPTGNLFGDGHLTIRPSSAGATINYARPALAFIRPGFSLVTLGSATTAQIRINSDGNNNPLTGSVKIGSPLELIAGLILVRDHIDQEAKALTFNTDTLTFEDLGAALGTGDVNFKKLTPGGTLKINGIIAKAGKWGTSNLLFDAPGSTVLLDRALGGVANKITVNADTFSHAYSTAIEAMSDVLLNVTHLTLGGGILVLEAT